jgi:TldD protein
LRDICRSALDVLNSSNVTYADIRVVNSNNEHIVYKNGKVGDLIQEESLGYGIRVLKNGAWGFASSHDIQKKTIKKTAELAVSIAEASAMTKKRDVSIVSEPAYQDTWTTPYIIDPFSVPIEHKLGLMEKIDKVCRKSKLIKECKVFMQFIKEHKYFANTTGSMIEQMIMVSGGGFKVTASNGKDIQSRSYPLSFDGLHQTTGYEIIHAMDMLSQAERVRDEAVGLLKAKECPAGQKKDIILMPSQLVLQIHESVGHPSELDRVLGYEADFAGTSFLTEDKLNNFKYGSDIVNLVADATIPGGLATQGYDDEGVRSKRWHIVKNGMLTGYMTNRETAALIGLEKSNGCCRIESFSDIPITRISNVSLMPDKGSLDDLIADTKDGILMDVNTSWSIDQQRLNFQFGCELGWEIKNGKIKNMLKNPYYKGITPEFWNSCDAICGPEEFKLLGVMNCGKGQPMQVNRMSHGCAPARFKKVMLGS